MMSDEASPKASDENNPDASAKAAPKEAPVAHIRVLVPEGMRVEDVVSRVEVSFETVEPTGAEINTNYCCVDASVGGPFSAVSYGPRGIRNPVVRGGVDALRNPGAAVVRTPIDPNRDRGGTNG